jgi:FAD-dependent urate hydroxylase
MDARPRDLEVAVIGAGPHALSAAIHLARAGVSTQLFGDTMGFWRTMPKGMTLRSNWSASNIAEPAGELSLAAYQADTGDSFGSPVPLDRFIDYGMWVKQRAAVQVDGRMVRRLDRDDAGFVLELDDGTRVTARRAIVAAGIKDFEWIPGSFGALPRERVSHTGHHSDMSVFAGQHLAVVGGGQSGLGSAALAREGGAEVEVFIRSPDVIWLRASSPKNRLGPVGPIVYAPTDVGPLWYSRLVATPDVFRWLPRRAQTRIAHRSIRPACSNQIRVRLDGVPLHLGRSVQDVRLTAGGVALALDDGRAREFDRVIFGTGYSFDVARYPFLAPALLAGLRQREGYPVLKRGLESSIPGLHFMGAAAGYSFGPITRFISGSWYAGRAVSRTIAAAQRRPAAVR